MPIDRNCRCLDIETRVRIGKMRAGVAIRLNFDCVCVFVPLVQAVTVLQVRQRMRKAADLAKCQQQAKQNSRSDPRPAPLAHDLMVAR